VTLIQVMAVKKTTHRGFPLVWKQKIINILAAFVAQFSRLENKNVPNLDFREKDLGPMTHVGKNAVRARAR
jgi:hypothetical protein